MLHLSNIYVLKVNQFITLFFPLIISKVYSKYTNACCYTNASGIKIAFNDYDIFKSTCLNLNPANSNRPERDGAWILGTWLEIRRELSIILGKINKSGQQRPWSAELWADFSTFSSTYLKYVFSVFDGNRANLNALYSELGKGIEPAHASDTGMRPEVTRTPASNKRILDASAQRQSRRLKVRESTSAKAVKKLPLGNKVLLTPNVDNPHMDALSNLKSKKKTAISEPMVKATLDETMAHNAAFTQQRSLLELLIDKGTAADKASCLDFIRQHAFVGVIGQSSLPHNRQVEIVSIVPENNFEDSNRFSNDPYDDININYHIQEENDNLRCCVVGTCMYADPSGSILDDDYLESCCENGMCYNVCYRECADVINETRICCQCRMR